ncbi:MAG TPA: c-type cytochrome [Vicinamibacterales bacterium]|nr:c-type cytochrome [Vicinamibacterales bacterium]
MTYRKAAAAAGLVITALMGYEAAAAWQARAWPPPVQKVAPDSPALAPEAELKTFIMPPGYRVELVASEPMVVDPVAMDVDLEGRLWIVEMLGFMPDTSGTDSREPIGRVAVLEDLDDDGRMDKRTVFLDKLILPRVVKVLERGVLVGEPPNLWLARDTNGDLVADEKEIVRKDYGRLEGNPEHNANSLHWALDNVMYTGEHTWHLELKNGEFRVQPTLSRGQWGVSSDDAGRIFRNWNEQPLFVDYLPARYYMRNPNVVRTRGLYEILMDPEDMTVWPVRPTRGVNRGYREGVLREDGTLTTYVSAGTPLIFRGDRLPKDLYGNAFVTESAGNLVHRLEVVDDGAGRLSARNAYDRGEFLASTDERFRPVNLFAGPDGTMFVIDMYRGVIQDGQYWTDYLRNYIKTNNLELPVAHGRIWRVVHESTERAPRPSLSKETSAGLVKLLSHPNGWHRDTAQRVLVERGDKSIADALKALAHGSADYRTRLHALWTLDGLDALEASAVERALSDSSPEVRASAIRLAERWLGEPDHPLLKSALARMDDRSWMVRLQLTASIGAMPPAARVEPLVTLLKGEGADPRNPMIVDAAISGLAGLESEVLSVLLQGSVKESARGEAVTMLAATMARARDGETATRLLDFAADEGRPMWQRMALLRGVELGLEGGGGGRGGGGGGGGGRGRGAAAAGVLALSQEPSSLNALAGGGGELAAVAKRVAGRLTWPGKPAPAVVVVPLTPEQQKRYSAGQEIYRNLCIACHQADGRGLEKIAPTLINSRYVVGDPGVGARIVIGGKEGAVGLMPPLGATLSDEQIASVLTYIRREWGHTASAVAPADVKEVRGMTSSRRRPWTEEELSRLVGGRGGRGG